jgi:hypothetical protein
MKERGGGIKERERRDGDLSRRWRAKLDAAWLKVKLSLFLTKGYVMKKYWGMEISI